MYALVRRLLLPDQFKLPKIRVLSEEFRKKFREIFSKKSSYNLRKYLQNVSLTAEFGRLFEVFAVTLRVITVFTATSFVKF